MAESFKDIREHLAALERAGKLIKITRAINKDTELMPLVRWQFRGLPESERKAFLFTNVVDVTGRKYDMPVAVGCLAASAKSMLSVSTVRWIRSRRNGWRRRKIRSSRDSLKARQFKKSFILERTCSVIKGWENFRCRFPRRVSITVRTRLRLIGLPKIRRRNSEHRQLPRPDKKSIAHGHSAVVEKPRRHSLGKVPG